MWFLILLRFHLFALTLKSPRFCWNMLGVFWNYYWPHYMKNFSLYCFMKRIFHFLQHDKFIKSSSMSYLPVYCWLKLYSYLHLLDQIQSKTVYSCIMFTKVKFIRECLLYRFVFSIPFNYYLYITYILVFLMKA